MADDKQQAQSGEADEAKTENKKPDTSEAGEMGKEEQKEDTPAVATEAPVAEKVKEVPVVEKKKDVEHSAVDTSKLTDEAKKVLDKVSEMTVLELAELVKVLEDKFGVSAAPVAVATAGGGAGGDASGGVEEKSAYNINLIDIGGNKIGVIKAVREVTDLGLKEAKDLVEAAPKLVREDVKKGEAEEIKKKLEDAGAKVELV